MKIRFGVIGNTREPVKDVRKWSFVGRCLSVPVSEDNWSIEPVRFNADRIVSGLFPVSSPICRAASLTLLAAPVSIPFKTLNR